MHEDEIHLARHLGSQGYRTALVGIDHTSSRMHDLGFDRIWNFDHSRTAARVAEVAGEMIDGFGESRDDPFFMAVGFFEGH